MLGLTMVSKSAISTSKLKPDLHLDEFCVRRMSEAEKWLVSPVNFDRENRAVSVSKDDRNVPRTQLAIGKPLPLALALTFTSPDIDPKVEGRERLLACFNTERSSSSSR